MGLIGLSHQDKVGFIWEPLGVEVENQFSKHRYSIPEFDKFHGCQFNQ